MYISKLIFSWTTCQVSCYLVSSSIVLPCQGFWTALSKYRSNEIVRQKNAPNKSKALQSTFKYFTLLKIYKYLITCKHFKNNLIQWKKQTKSLTSRQNMRAIYILSCDDWEYIVHIWQQSQMHLKEVCQYSHLPVDQPFYSKQFKTIT